MTVARAINCPVQRYPAHGKLSKSRCQPYMLLNWQNVDTWPRYLISRVGRIQRQHRVSGRCKTKTEGINAAINHLVTRPEIDNARLAGLGICASGGYMSGAAATNPNIESFAQHPGCITGRSSTMLTEGKHPPPDKQARLELSARLAA